MLLLPLATVVAALLSDAATDLPAPVRPAMRRPGKLLVVVDVQPTYERFMPFRVSEVLTHANRFDEVLWLYNGEVCGLDEAHLQAWIVDHVGPSRAARLFQKTRFYDKGYAFLRGWMDQGVDRATMVGTLRAMLLSRTSDARDLPPEALAHLDTRGVATDEAFYVPDVTARLVQWDGATICGGAEHECLLEVELLAEAMGLTFTRHPPLIYAGT